MSVAFHFSQNIHHLFGLLFYRIHVTKSLKIAQSGHLYSISPIFNLVSLTLLQTSLLPRRDMQNTLEIYNDNIHYFQRFHPSTFYLSSVTRKNRQMFIKVAQKWFH